MKFNAYGPPGQLSCSKTASGTNMRWRAQTGYESNRRRLTTAEEETKEGNAMANNNNVFQKGLIVKFQNEQNSSNNSKIAKTISLM